MIWLLRLYPREWRRRYGAEAEEVVASQPRSLQLVIDLLAGAVDAHVKPQETARRVDGATAADPGGSNMWIDRFGCCARSGVSRKDTFIGSGLTLAFALVVAGLMLVGSSPLTQTVAMTMFPGVLSVGTLSIRLRGHSTAAKFVVIGGTFLVLLLIGLVAGLLRSA
jgi:hypothetical protein